MSPTDCESSSQGRSGSSKTSAASETFREDILREGYHGSISATPLVRSQFPEVVANATKRYATKQYDDDFSLEQFQRQGPADEEVVRLGKALSKAAADDELYVEEDWNRQVWIPYYNALRDLQPSLRSTGNVFWWKDGYPQSRDPDKDLAAPKPVVAIGLRVHQTGTAGSITKGPFDWKILKMLHYAPDLCLRPCPPGLPSAPNAVAYPTFVHEIKSVRGTQHFVENKLSKSLVWLLHQQDELRKAALELDPTASNTELPIFGVTSVGKDVKLFSATGTSSTGFRIVEEGNILNMFHPAGACAFAAFCLSAFQWTKDVYLPQIAEWITTVNAHIHKRRQVALSCYTAGTSATTPLLQHAQDQS